MDKRTFEVVVEREGRWWVFDIPELGTGGQARDLAEVDQEAVGVAAMWLNVDPSTVAVNVTVEGQDEALAAWAAAERAEVDALGTAEWGVDPAAGAEKAGSAAALAAHHRGRPGPRRR